ncbi:2OG-Fe(II) oxygenase [Marinicauda algicola]|uniref:2OG-Fe(II) oxygenase n=1 Tax=Marinicauda algicola TaxID=2029849 RepID=A0A4S2H4H2_9PROT|nr:2OG-Fe(II) oxygenase [Marinicauda algicola]TGY90301.1 2OG-Fe(II) oxygenase [Marinicauda algicola]
MRADRRDAQVSVIDSLVNERVKADTQALHRKFASAEPFQHVVIDNFFKPEVAEAMLADFPAEKEPEKLLNEFGAPNPKSVRSDVSKLKGIYPVVDQYIQTEEFLQLMTAITGIPDLKYDPWYYGAGTHENFHTAGLDPHYDFNIHPKTGYHRRLNAIVYLNKDWKPEWNGAIALHSDPWDLKNDQVTAIAPEFNRCVVFETTESSWHSVTPVDLPEDERRRSRKSFTIYLYTPTRPDAAPEHGTVYVQLPLPKHIKAGHTLTEQDVAEIDANIARRHEYLRNLYKRELQFSRVIDELREQLKERCKMSNVPLLGYATLVEVGAPVYTDGWLGKEFSCTIRPRRPASGVTVKLWKPEGSEPLAFTLTVDGITRSFEAGGGFSECTVEFSELRREPFDVRLEAPGAQRASDKDVRELSAVLDSVEVLSLT